MLEIFEALCEALKILGIWCDRVAQTLQDFYGAFEIHLDWCDGVAQKLQDLYGALQKCELGVSNVSSALCPWYLYRELCRACWLSRKLYGGVPPGGGPWARGLDWGLPPLLPLVK